MSRLPQTNEIENATLPIIEAFCRRFKVSSHLHAAGAYKQRGIPVIVVFLRLISQVFTNRTLFMSLQCADSADIGKDTFYRFVNSCHVNWLKFSIILAKSVINDFISRATGDGRVNVFIVDDTVYARKRSKKVELLGWVRDHANNVSVRGFRLLTLGWSDGNSFIPVAGNLLASVSKSIYGQKKGLDKRSCGYKQRLRAMRKAPSVMLDMLESALALGLKASYVLFDSWFASPATILSVLERGLHVVAMLKKTPKVHYLYNGEMLSVTEIYRRNRKRRGRSKYLLSVEVHIRRSDDHTASVPAKLVYVRNRNKRKDYLVLISTDVSISEEEVIRIYGKRWKIELFFKVCKSYLRLTSECRSLSYDAMTAYVSIVFARYTMLAAEQRVQTDEKSLGELFYLLCDELPDITWLESLRILMDILTQVVSEKLFLSEEELKSLLDDFIDALPGSLKSKLKKCA